MTYLERLEQLYRDYVAEVAKLNRKGDKQSMGGLFGFIRPSQDPCHSRFAEELETLLAEAAQAELSSEDVRALVDFVFLQAEEQSGDRVIYWMLLAGHGMTQPLLGQLPSGDCAVLLDWYEKHYPRSGLLPVQKEVIKLLRRGAKG